jgi:hypothetical protein
VKERNETDWLFMQRFDNTIGRAELMLELHHDSPNYKVMSEMMIKHQVTMAKADKKDAREVRRRIKSCEKVRTKMNSCT